VSFLDPTVISKLESFSVRARVVAEGALSGIHRSAQRGSSVEFAEYKEYSPGDEIKHIDWRVYAKADRYVVRQFEQESQLTAQLILDASGSMTYGSESRSESTDLTKLGYAAHLIGALAHLVIKQRDKAGLYVFGDRKVETYIPPRGRASHSRDLLSVIGKTLEASSGGDESAAEAIERAAELTARRRQMIVVASDFFDRELDRVLDALKWLRARGHDVTVFHVLHPDELGLPFEGLSKFVAFESDRELLAAPRAIRREYMSRLKAFLNKVESSCIAAGVEYRPCSTSEPLETVLGDFLAARSGDLRKQGAQRPTEAAWNL